MYPTGRIALRATQRIGRPAVMRSTRLASTAAPGNPGVAAGKGQQKSPLKEGAKRDPELYILLAIMSGAFALVGFHFGRKPTSASSEQTVAMAPGSAPWQVESASGNQDFKYQYHPGGDKSKAPKDAPSALNTVIIPAVNLPKHLHEKYNKWGKDGY